MARTKRSATHSKLAKLMRGIDLCMLTTRAGKSFHARPMSNNGEVDFDGDAWFFTWRKTAKVKEIEKDSQVALSYVGGSKKEPVWIAVSGTAKIVDDPEKKQELWLDELEQWFEDGPDDPDIVLIHVKAARAEWWSYKDAGKVQL